MSPPSPSLRAFASPLRIHQQEKERSAACLWVRPGFGVATHAPVQFCTPALFLVGPGHLRGPGYRRFQGGSWAYHSPQCLSAFGGFARLRLTHLPLSGEPPTILQQEARLIFLKVVACPEQPANRASSWSGRSDSNRRQAPWKGAVLPLNYAPKLARQEGLEPSTRGIEARCSIRLSYWRKNVAGMVGIEPTTWRLTAACSTD